jgi:hypothetical protein
MWTAISVGILVLAQAGASPASSRPQAAAGAPATAAAKPAATASSAATDTATEEAPATAARGEATLRFRNDVGNAFQMTEARFAMDGRSLPTLLTSAEHGQDYVIFAGPITPGRHVITSHISYQGQSRGTIFTYMKGYTFNIDSTHEINVPEGGTTNATIVGKTNKGFNVPFEQSLIVEMEPPTGLGGAR